MKKKRILSVLLALVMVFSMTATPAMAATGKTVTFNGGHIYQTEKGKPGTAQVTISNITKTKKNVKISEKSLIKDYTETKETANTIFGYTTDFEQPITLTDVVSEGVTVYYADKASVTITTKSPMSCFWFCYTGTVEKAKYTPKFYDFNDYLSHQGKAKVLTKQPKGDYLLAPGTTAKLNKPGKYIFIVKDDGTIDGSPISAFCVIVK